MANRYMSYGYEITDGKITVIETEKEIVFNIFGMYINGHSMLEISNRMNQAGIAYNNDGRAWNKNIIKRMLENRKYLGEDGFPQIIPHSTFVQAEEKRLTKAPASNDERKEFNEVMRESIVCGCCGRSLSRYKGSKRSYGYPIYCRCKNEGCVNPATAIKEKELISAMVGIINHLIGNPTTVKAENVEMLMEDEKEVGINFEAELSNPENEIKDIVEMITRASELRFEQCMEQDFTAMDEYIRKRLNVHTESEELNIKLLKDITKNIRLYPNRMVEIELKNGNRFKGGAKIDRCNM